MRRGDRSASVGRLLQSPGGAPSEIWTVGHLSRPDRSEDNDCADNLQQGQFLPKPDPTRATAVTGLIMPSIETELGSSLASPRNQSQ